MIDSLVWKELIEFHENPRIASIGVVGIGFNRYLQLSGCMASRHVVLYPKYPCTYLSSFDEALQPLGVSFIITPMPRPANRPEDPRGLKEKLMISLYLLQNLADKVPLSFIA